MAIQTRQNQILILTILSAEASLNQMLTTLICQGVKSHFHCMLNRTIRIGVNSYTTNSFFSAFANANYSPIAYVLQTTEGGSTILCTDSPEAS